MAEVLNNFFSFVHIHMGKEEDVPQAGAMETEEKLEGLNMEGEVAQWLRS